MNIFITGVSSGIGLALAKQYVELGHQVYGLSRRPCSDQRVIWQQCDLANLDEIEKDLLDLIGDLKTIDIAILNAGVLGHIQDLQDAELSELRKSMDINLWSNKVIIDFLAKQMTALDQVITLSSGAAVNGNRGWSGYSISKAALNMMTALYAKELPQTHFTAFAPGLVDTAMQDYLCSLELNEKTNTLERIQLARGTEAMPTAEQLAHKLPEIFVSLQQYPSGSFVDIRKM